MIVSRSIPAPPPEVNLANYLILNYDPLRPSDSVVLNLPRGGLAPPILCQLPGALRVGSKAADHRHRIAAEIVRRGERRNQKLKLRHHQSPSPNSDGKISQQRYFLTPSPPWPPPSAPRRGAAASPRDR